MRLTDDQARSLLARAEFGVLGTVDADRGVHLVPVVFIVEDDRLIIPVDVVKPKASVQLRRIRNLEAEPRASLLVDHRSSDWSELWWVRADLMFHVERAPSPGELQRFGSQYPDYRVSGSVASVLEFGVASVVGWAAERIETPPNPSDS